jgi:ADP-ribose pyrophosphatase YjhB (NUDIX family)
VDLRVPDGDDRPRHVCATCGTIHYQNPKMVVGCIPEWEDRILLCRRAIQPRYGLWTLPAGFMENGETSIQGAARETREEANARVEVGGLYTLFNLPHIDQVYLIFRGRLLDLDFGPGAESLEVGLFAEPEIPWDQIAFPVVKETLGLYFRDRADGGYRTRCGDIVRLDGDIRRYRVRIHAGG